MKYIIVNTKDNFNETDALNYYNNIKDFDYSKIKFIICPLNNQFDIFENREYCLGSQDLNSIEILKKHNVTHCIVGHASKRLLGESDDQILEKANILQQYGIKPILCIGEKEEDKDAVLNVITNQIDNIYEGLFDKNHIIVAYEPTWSIGSSELLDIGKIDLVINYIKKHIKDVYGIDASVVYGGNVNKDNVQELSFIKPLDGFMISTGALDVCKLKEIFKNIEE